jgi:hypothetical protein
MATPNEKLLASLLHRLTFAEMMSFATLVAGTLSDAEQVNEAAEALLEWAENVEMESIDE